MSAFNVSYFPQHVRFRYKMNFRLFCFLLVTGTLGVGKQVKGVHLIINGTKQENVAYRNNTGTESTPHGERTKGSGRFRGGNQQGDGVQVCLMRHRCLTIVAGVRNNE